MSNHEFTETQRVDIGGRQFDLIPVPNMAVAEGDSSLWLGRMGGVSEPYDLCGDDERVYVLREVQS